MYAFARILEDEEVIVVVNTAKEQADAISTVNLQFEPQKVVYGSGRLNWHNTTEAKKLEIIVPAQSSMIVV